MMFRLVDSAFDSSILELLSMSIDSFTRHELSSERVYDVISNLHQAIRIKLSIYMHTCISGNKAYKVGESAVSDCYEDSNIDRSIEDDGDTQENLISHSTTYSLQGGNTVVDDKLVNTRMINNVDIKSFQTRELVEMSKWIVFLIEILMKYVSCKLKSVHSQFDSAKDVYIKKYKYQLSNDDEISQYCFLDAEAYLREDIFDWLGQLSYDTKDERILRYMKTFYVDIVPRENKYGNLKTRSSECSQLLSQLLTDSNDILSALTSPQIFSKLDCYIEIIFQLMQEIENHNVDSDIESRHVSWFHSLLGRASDQNNFYVLTKLFKFYDHNLEAVYIAYDFYDYQLDIYKSLGLSFNFTSSDINSNFKIKTVAILIWLNFIVYVEYVIMSNHSLSSCYELLTKAFFIWNKYEISISFLEELIFYELKDLNHSNNVSNLGLKPIVDSHLQLDSYKKSREQVKLRHQQVSIAVVKCLRKLLNLSPIKYINSHKYNPYEKINNINGNHVKKDGINSQKKSDLVHSPGGKSIRFSGKLLFYLISEHGKEL